MEWRTGDEVRVTVEDVPGTHDRVSTTYEGLAKDAREGDALLVDDGKVALLVRKVEDSEVVCEVIQGGTVSDHKGLSLPGMNVSVPAMSPKDFADLEFALRLRVDLIGAVVRTIPGRYRPGPPHYGRGARRPAAGDRQAGEA